MLLLAMFTRVLALFYLQATASRLRRVVFSILLLWATVDGCLTFRDWWQNNRAPLVVCVLGFLGSVVFSLWFIGLIAMTWDWLARRLQSGRFKGTLKNSSVANASSTQGEAHHVAAAAGIAAPAVPTPRSHADVKSHKVGRVALHLPEDDDSSQVFEQLFRVFRRDLKPAEMGAASRWAIGITRIPILNGDWRQKHEDAFVHGLERFIWEGHFPNDEAHEHFADITDSLRQKYPTLAGSPIGVELSEDMRQVCRTIFGIEPLSEGYEEEKLTATQTVCDSEADLYGRLKFVPKEQSAQMLERGRYHSENGFKNIGDWEERMVKELGESVVEFLPDVWNEIKRDRNPTELSSSNRNPNRALDLLKSSYSHHPCVARLVGVLSDLAKGLYSDAEGSTATLLAAFEVEIAPSRRRLLVECILDLELVSSFGEVVDYTKDNALASCYVDAILFQATGEESNGCPSDGQYRNEGTHTCRGIAKYGKAKEYFKVADPTAWLFGKEFGAIVFDDARDIAYVAGVQPLTALIRAHGVWRTRYALTGEVPTTDEQNKVIAFV